MADGGFERRGDEFQITTDVLFSTMGICFFFGRDGDMKGSAGGESQNREMRAP